VTAFGWQDVVATLIVLGSLGYLIRRKLRARPSPPPCGDCPGCASVPVAQASETLVTIGVTPRRTDG
jgi:hypothetical protein